MGVGNGVHENCDVTDQDEMTASVSPLDLPQEVFALCSDTAPFERCVTAYIHVELSSLFSSLATKRCLL